jgi:hypothetical protein
MSWDLKGRIDKEGLLWIRRNEREKEQLCPFGGRLCGDHCPQFGEPEPVPSIAKSAAGLRICHGHNLFFRDLRDERERPKQGVEETLRLLDEGKEDVVQGGA